MYDCSTIMKLIHPHLDGELDVKESLRVEAHLQECSRCRENFLAEREWQNLLQQHRGVAPAPEFAYRCLSTALDREARQRIRWRRSWRLPLAAAAVAAFGVVAALIAMDGSSPGVSPLVNLAVESHERFVRQPASLEITSNDGAAVSSWLSQRLRFDVGIPGSGSDDIQLLGGRVVTDEQTRAAYVAYRAGDETVSLLMTPPQEIRFRGGEVISFRNILFHPADVAGYHTLEWSDSRHTYVLVSSSPRAVYQACVICHRSKTERELLSGFTNGI